MEALKVVFLSVAAAIAYGILQDQVTARVCVEYFTIGHPPVFDTEDPTLLAFGWGVIATWWVGVLLGVPLAFAARVGAAPKLTARKLIKPITLLMMAVAVTALLAGLCGYFVGLLEVPSDIARQLPIHKQRLYMADAYTHTTAYGAGFVGGIVVCIGTWRKRKGWTLTP